MYRLILLSFGLLTACGSPWPVNDTDVVPDDTSSPDTHEPIDPRDDPTTVGSTLLASGVIICQSPGLNTVTPYELLIEGEHWGGTHDWMDNEPGIISAAGIAVDDFNGDGHYDLFITGRSSPRYYLSTGELQFDDATDTLPNATPSKSASASAIDIDVDGDMDLFVGGYKEPNALLINDGSGVFTDGTEAAGFTQYNYRTVGSSWADFDLDGDLDVYIPNYGVPQGVADPSLLYENDGNGVFSISDWELPKNAVEGHAFIGGWFDLNDDLYPELYVVNDFSWMHPNPLLWNQGDSFLEDDGTAGLRIKANCMGLGIGDINLDGVPDMMVPAWNRLDLLMSLNGEPLYYSAATVLGINLNKNTQRQLGWASEMHDFDNDTDLDIYVVFGYLNADPPNSSEQPDALYVQQFDGSFVEQATTFGLGDRGMSRGVAILDLNNDGWLDIVKPNKNIAAKIYLATCGAEHWVRVKLEQPGANPKAIGARVRVLQDDQAWTRWISLSSTGLASSVPPEAHFGLGSLTTIQRLEVRWPDGEYSQYEQLEADQILTIRREE
jgi:hypothetical protein